METQKRITIKSLKVVESASQETLFFTANVYLDNRLLGVASNGGCGGCTEIDFPKDKTKLFNVANEYAKAFTDKTYCFEPPLVSLIDEMVNDMHADKKIQSMFKRHIKKLVMVKGKEIFIFSKIIIDPTKDNTKTYDLIRKENGDNIIILNELSLEEAFTQYSSFMR